MKRIHYIGLFLLLLCFSCIRDVELKLDPVPPVLVLNASVTPDHEVSAFLSKSWFLLDSVPEFELPESGTKVHVYVNDMYRGAMQRIDKPDSTQFIGQFSLPGCFVRTGDRVRLEAQATGFDPVYAETHIPAKTPILMVDTSRVISSDYGYAERLRFYIMLKDDPSMRNYYRLVLERVIEYHEGDKTMRESSFNDNTWWSRPNISGDTIDLEKYMKNGFYGYSHFQLSYDDPVFQPGPPSLDRYDGAYCRGVFSDDLLNGKEYSVTSSIYPDTSLKYDSLTSVIHYDIHLLSISEDYYYYLKVIRNFSISLGDAYLDGLLEPTATYSNVNNGFGVVTGYQVSTQRVTMPF